MDASQSPQTPPSQYQQPQTAPKKGLGTGAKIGIGCGVIVLLAIVGIIISVVMLGGKLKQFTDEAQKNPARASANLMVSVSNGQMTMVAEDDVLKRYTVKDTKTGALTTIYWSEAKKAPEVIQGDFSAIPANPPATGSASEPAPDGAGE